MLSKALVACTDRRPTRHLSVSARVNQHHAVLSQLDHSHLTDLHGLELSRLRSIAEGRKGVLVLRVTNKSGSEVTFSVVFSDHR